VPAGIMKIPYAMFVRVDRHLLHYRFAPSTMMNVLCLAREPKWQEDGWMDG
jgi:hypothetical protein